MKKIVLAVQALFLAFCLLLPTAVAGAQSVSGWTIEGYSRNTETVNFTRREETGLVMLEESWNFPNHNVGLDLPNICATIAGVNLIAYYNNFRPELIPDFTGYRFVDGKKQYHLNREHITPIAQTLYTSMKTNQSVKGTTVANFKSGITSFAQSKGLKTSSESSMVFLNLFFNLDAYKSFIQQKKPVVITTRNSSYIKAVNFPSASGKTTDTLPIENVSAAHMMVGYGYVKYNYYRMHDVLVWSPVWYNPLRFVTEKHEGIFRTDEYLLVSFGDDTCGYLSLNKSSISDAFTMHIYK